MNGMPAIPHPVRRDVSQDAGRASARTMTMSEQHIVPAAGGRLTGRIALIAGGGGGIGRAVAQLFVSEGAAVVVGDLEMATAKTVADSLGPNAEAVALDVRNPADWAAALDATRNHFGAPPDVLVQSAGVMVAGRVDSVAEADMRLAFDVNVLGVLNGIQAVTPGMRAAGRGSIVAITSMAGVTFGVPDQAPYCASKAAATALVQCAALDLGPDRIRVNAIVPGQVDTPMSRSAATSAPASFFERMPVPRIGQPRDIAQAALDLASDESSWVTGTKLLIDGGMVAGPGLG